MLALVAALAGNGRLLAQEADLAAEEEEAAPAPAPAAAAKKPRTMGRDKSGIEAYLKHRLSAMKVSHKARLDIMTKDSQEWSAFWNKVKDERNLFEVRIARQRLDLFESLGSLEAKEHSATIADFERLQTGVIRAFEKGQQARMQEFFTARERRWRDFYAAQEKERAALAAEVDASWSQLKSAMKMKGSTSTKSTPSTRKF
ncbi:MAG: hypothetical protein HY554_14080 [Elusimicrobia bacterium]|nr:hypothetical protein [Elusimicrobiota bacterium]